MSGKGSKRRPLKRDRKGFDDEWERLFERRKRRERKHDAEWDAHFAACDEELDSEDYDDDEN